MVQREEILERLRAATNSENRALAKILGIELSDESDVNVVRLSDAFRSAASEKEYRKIVATVAKEVAGKAGWKLEPISDTAQTVWIEDYVYHALGFVHRPDLKTLSDHEKAIERERAEQALQGKLAAPHAQSEAALVGIAGAAALGFFFGLWFVVPVFAAGVLTWLLGPSMKKVVPATLILIHIRKRQEFEAVLSNIGSAA